MTTLLLICLSIGIACVLPLAEAAPRLVTANLCADSLALILAPEHTRAVTHLARDPHLSPVADRAAGYPIHNGTAEAMLPFAPTLIVGGDYTTTAALELLERLDYSVARLPMPQSTAEVIAVIRQFAALVDAVAQGEQLIAALEPALIPTPARATALVYLPNGFTVGRHTLMHDLLAAAGYDNAAPFDGWGFLSVEQVLWRQPHTLVFSDEDTAFSLARLPLRHPALTPPRTVSLASRAWGCPGPWLIDAVDELRR